MFDITIPLKKLENQSDILGVGTYKLVYENRTAGVIDPENSDLKKYDNKSLNLGYVSFGLSEKVVILRRIRYNKKNRQFIFIIEIAKNPLLSAAVVTAITSIAAISAVALIWVKGEKIILIPSLAVIAASGVYFYQKFT